MINPCLTDEKGDIVSEFSQRLSQSYEEINLLFRMSHFLNSADEPAGVIRVICNQISQIMPFGWLAIGFRDAAGVAPSLAGLLATAGELGCSPAELQSATSDLRGYSDLDDWTQVLLPGKDALATLTGHEVLAEPISHNGKCVGIILAGNKRGEDSGIASDEIQFIDAAADFLGVFHENMARFAEQRAQFLGTLHALSAAIDAKDPYTCGHSDRVSLLAAKLANALYLPWPDVEQYRIAGQLHDVGKIGVPEAVLCKSGRLTEEEFAQIKKHPEIGHRILKDIPAMEVILPGVLHHHERWDGCGYPHRLAGEQIPLIAQCISLADTFDAMSSMRSYRRAMTRQQVLAEISRCAGTQFKPELAALFVTLDFSDFDEALRIRTETAKG